MANFTAADVKRLRDQTGAGMMDCKNALAEAEGDFDSAVELLRVKGVKDAGKRATRTAANGLVTAELADHQVGVLARAELRDRLRGQDRPVPANGRRRSPAGRARRPGSSTGCPRWPSRPGRASPSSSSSRRPARQPQGEAGARPVRALGGRIRGALPAPDRRGAAADHRRAGPAGPGKPGDRPGSRPADRRRPAAVPRPATTCRPTWWRRSAGSPSRSPATRASPSRPYRRSSRAG